MQKLGMATLIAAGGLLIASALVPYLSPRDTERSQPAHALLLEEADVLLRMSTGDAPRIEGEALDAHLDRLRALATAVGDPETMRLVAALPKAPLPKHAGTVAALARITARAHAVQATRTLTAERDHAGKIARATAVLFWPGVVLLISGVGFTYVGLRRVLIERTRLDRFLPSTDEPLDVRALRLVESHNAAHDRLIERSRERRDLLAEKQVLEDFKLYDPLTRLLRDDACIERAVPLVGEFLYRGSSYFVAMMDLDLFKSINDTHGHEAGDAALRHFARALTAAGRDGILVSRQHAGGDEFVAIGPGTDEDLLAFRDRLLQHLQTHPLALSHSNDVFTIGVTIGYTLPSEQLVGVLRANDTPRGRAVTLLKQIKQCDNALYMAKRSGRGSVKKFEPGLVDVSPDNPALESFLRIDRHIRGDVPHLPAELQAPIAEALERTANALEAALHGRVVPPGEGSRGFLRRGTPERPAAPLMCNADTDGQGT